MPALQRLKIFTMSQFMGQIAFCISPVSAAQGLGEKRDAQGTLCWSLINSLSWQVCAKPKSEVGWSPESSDSSLCGTGNVGQD